MPVALQVLALVWTTTVPSFVPESAKHLSVVVSKATNWHVMGARALILMNVWSTDLVTSSAETLTEVLNAHALMGIVWIKCPKHVLVSST